VSGGRHPLAAANAAKFEAVLTRLQLCAG
jgi:hypothetical protein